MPPGYLRRIRVTLALVLVAIMLLPLLCSAAEPANYGDLMRLFTEWRGFTRPPMANGVQDYSAAAIKAKTAELPKWRKRLEAIEPRAGPLGS